LLVLESLIRQFRPQAQDMAMLHGVAYITFGNIGQPCVMQTILDKLDELTEQRQLRLRRVCG